MTVQTDPLLQQMIDHLAGMYEALILLREEHAARQPDLYRIFAEGPMDDIRKTTREIEEYTGFHQLREADADIWIRIEGEGVEWASAPTSILTAILDAFRKGLQSVAEMMERGTLAPRPTRELKEAADLRLVGLAPGSLQVALKLPEPEEAADQVRDAAAVDYRSVMDRALAEFLEVAAAVSEGGMEASRLVEDRADPHQKRVVLNAVKNVLPRKRGTIRLVEFRGRTLGGRAPVRLTRQSHGVIDAALDRLAVTKVETHRGFLREIDLDAKTFQVRQADDPTVVRCSFEEEFMEVAKEALDRLVEVTGTRARVEGRRTTGTLELARLEIIDDEDLTEPGG